MRVLGQKACRHLVYHFFWFSKYFLDPQTCFHSFRLYSVSSQVMCHSCTQTRRGPIAFHVVAQTICCVLQYLSYYVVASGSFATPVLSSKLKRWHVCLQRVDHFELATPLAYLNVSKWVIVRKFSWQKKNMEFYMSFCNAVFFFKLSEKLGFWKHLFLSSINIGALSASVDLVSFI